MIIAIYFFFIRVLDLIYHQVTDSQQSLFIYQIFKGAKNKIT